MSRICADDTMRAVTDDQPPAELLGTVRDLAEARRRRNRWRFLSAAAAVVVIAGGLFGGLMSAKSTTRTNVISPFPAGATQWETAQVTDKITGESAEIAYASALWGHTFEILTENIPLGTTCQMWVIHPNGTRTQVAAWTTASDEGRAWYSGSLPSTAGPIKTFQITANHKVLLSVTPD